MNDADKRLEDEIDRAGLMFACVGTRRGREMWARRLEALVRKRRPARVLEMERERGLMHE